MKNNLLNIFGLGKKSFSASLASALSVPLYLFFHFLTKYTFELNIIAFILVAVISGIQLRQNKSYAIQDPKEIIIDEFLGMYIILIIVNQQSILKQFLLLISFRIIDILKPFPFNWIEQKCNNEFGLLIDDIAIGIFIASVYVLLF